MFPAALLKALLSPQGLHRAGRCLPLRCSGKSAWPGAHQCHRGEDRTVWPRSLLALLQKTSVTGRGHGAFSSPPMAAQEPGNGRASCLCLHPSAQRAVLARCPDTGPRAEAAPELLLSTPGHARGHSSTPFSCTPCPTVSPGTAQASCWRCPQPRGSAGRDGLRLPAAGHGSALPGRRGGSCQPVPR